MNLKLRPDGTYVDTTLGWKKLLKEKYHDYFANKKKITWKRGDSASIIDYIFCSASIQSSISNPSQQFISNTETDHVLLLVELIY